MAPRERLVSVHVSAVSNPPLTTCGTGTIAPDGISSDAVAIDIQQPQPSPLQSFQENLREALHQVVAERRVVVALAAQAGAVEDRGADVADRLRVEVPHVWRRSHDQPITSLASIVSTRREPRVGLCRSIATVPCRMT